MALDDSHHDDERAVALAVAERTVARYGDNVLRLADVETQLTAMKVMVYLAIAEHDERTARKRNLFRLRLAIVGLVVIAAFAVVIFSLSQ
jgi:alkylation response protein AidB-like acyl-CoA dehydrogenase